MPRTSGKNLLLNLLYPESLTFVFVSLYMYYILASFILFQAFGGSVAFCHRHKNIGVSVLVNQLTLDHSGVSEIVNEICRGVNIHPPQFGEFSF